MHDCNSFVMTYVGVKCLTRHCSVHDVESLQQLYNCTAKFHYISEATQHNIYSPSGSYELWN